ncbi:hypothetical protein RSAG8_10748, partial [Rhizoctonia solani AG-8 WAC10335]
MSRQPPTNCAVHHSFERVDCIRLGLCCVQFTQVFITRSALGQEGLRPCFNPKV